MIDPDDLLAWCAVPGEELQGHPDAAIRIEVVETIHDVYRTIAHEMYAELLDHDAREMGTRWILPCGPMGQYEILADLVNAGNVRMDRVQVFHMDDFLDWQGRPLSVEHPFSMRGAMERGFYALFDERHTIPEQNRHYPDVFAPDALSESIAAAGGVDTAWGGIGYRGHVAFNESPRSPWHTVTVEQLAASKTRIVPLNDDTMVAMSQRNAGGLTQIVPPLGLTIGLSDLLAARRVRLFSTTGAWKQAVIRVAAFSRPSSDYPVTLFSAHPNASILVDAMTATSPLKDAGV